MNHRPMDGSSQRIERVMGKIRKDLTGKTYERLTVLRHDGFHHGRGQNLWLCRCVCGKEVSVTIGDLQARKSKSCGCLKIERIRNLKLSHGMTNTSEFSIWKDIKKRCLNKNHAHYVHYGGRGISITDHWLDFAVFYSDMGPRPSEIHSIERVDVNGNYSKQNCIWATQLQQSRNKRTNHFVSLQERKMILKDACELLGAPYHRTADRINKLGWSFDEAVEIKPRKGYGHGFRPKDN